MDCHEFRLALDVLLFAIPGVIMAIVWYFVIRTHPEESSHVNEAEVEYIKMANLFLIRKQMNLFLWDCLTELSVLKKL